MKYGILEPVTLRHPRKARRGLSVLEVLGCLVAVAVGVGAGALYLGIDLMAVAGLANETPAGPDEQGATGGSPGSLSAVGMEPTGRTGSHEVRGSTPAIDVGEATLTHWDRLRGAIQEERQSRSQTEQQAGRNMRAVLRARSEIYAMAAQNIREIPSDAVDPESRQLAEELVEWYVRGAELADEGSTLLDEGELSAAQGPIGRRWHTAQKQHQEELDLLSRKCRSLRGKLSARYGRRFAELQ